MGQVFYTRSFVLHNNPIKTGISSHFLDGETKPQRDEQKHCAQGHPVSKWQICPILNLRFFQAYHAESLNLLKMESHVSKSQNSIKCNVFQTAVLDNLTKLCLIGINFK